MITDAQRTLEADKHESRANTSMDCVASQKKPFDPLGDLETVARQGNTHTAFFSLSRWSYMKNPFSMGVFCGWGIQLFPCPLEEKVRKHKNPDIQNVKNVRSNHKSKHT